MNKFTKTAVGVTALAAALVLCSCGGTGQKESAANVAVTAAATEAATAAATAAATPAPVSDTVKTGTVLEASMHRIVIEAPDGTTYAFTTGDDTEIVGKSENLGDTVSVEYEGEYKENMAAKRITIDKEADTEVADTAEEVTTDKSEEKSAKTVSSSAPKYITGTVVDASMNNITVNWNDENYTILKTDSTTVEGDVQVGSTVRVYHTGDIADGVEAIDISVVAPEITNPDIRYITGTVVDASMNTIVIERDGHTYSVLKDDNTKSDSVQPGDTVRVYHKGSYSDGMTATSIIKE